MTAAAGAMIATASADVEREKPNPWLDCGIGAAIFPGDNVEVAAAISNIIWDWGTTAVTSAQSSPDTCNGLSNVAMAQFVQSTYASLETELATGEGENLAALAELVGASDAEAFAVALREEFAPVVASGEANAEKLYYAAEAVAKG